MVFIWEADAVMDHSSLETHVVVRDRILRELADNGKFIEREARQRLYVRPLVNPSITWRETQKPKGEPLDEVLPNGSTLIQDPSVNQHHLVLDFDQCVIIPAASFDPGRDYLNGISELTADGWVQGHIHWTCYAVEDEQQVNDHEAGKQVPYPDSFFFLGGPRSYTSKKMPDGSWRIMSETFTGKTFIPGLLYIMKVEIVNIDDSKVPTVIHGQNKDFTKIFQVRAKAA